MTKVSTEPPAILPWVGYAFPGIPIAGLVLKWVGERYNLPIPKRIVDGCVLVGAGIAGALAALGFQVRGEHTAKVNSAEQAQKLSKWTQVVDLTDVTPTNRNAVKAAFPPTVKATQVSGQDGVVQSPVR